MTNEEIFYDHYKETVSIIKDKIRERDRFFILLFLTMAFQFLFAIVPDGMISILINVINSVYSVDISEQVIIIQSLLWLILLYFTMRYYQSIVFIERQYKYISNLESQISITINYEFGRESIDYLQYYPKMNDMIDLMYKWIFPILYCLVICLKIGAEIKNIIFVFPIIFDFLIFVLCLTLTILYLIFLHGKKPENNTNTDSNSE